MHMESRIITCLCIGILFQACAYRALPDREIGLRIEPNYAVINVFFATDRKEDSSDESKAPFGPERGELKYGMTQISIPRDHRMGELESPSVIKLEFREDPSKHIVLLKTVISSEKKFFEDLASRVRKSSKEAAFLFVHGYNVTFEDAARRTAQITYDIGFDGAPVFYSWPSQGTSLAYVMDEQNIEWAQSNIRGFLEDFFTRSEARNIYLIAHSMGNRALVRSVLSLLAEKPAFQTRLKEIILTAPDIDADVFRRDIAPALAAAGRPITLYASSEDVALAASRKIHGNSRAGESGDGLIISPGIETIDATGVDTNFLNHSYFAEARSVLGDLFSLIRRGERANQRFGLVGVEGQSGQYWKFKR